MNGGGNNDMQCAIVVLVTNGDMCTHVIVTRVVTEVPVPGNQSEFPRKKTLDAHEFTREPLVAVIELSRCDWHEIDWTTRFPDSVPNFN